MCEGVVIGQGVEVTALDQHPTSRVLGDRYKGYGVLQ